MNTLDTLVHLLAKLPGIGKKTATRLAYYILDSPPSYAKELANHLTKLHEQIRRCSVCGNYTENNPCPICQDPARDRSLLCVVEKPQDIRVIEEGKEFRGHYHVLGGLITPLEGINPEQLSIGPLLSRVRQEGVREVILALNPTIEGDTTALYIHKLLKETGVSVTRLAAGLPIGGDLEYVDRLTLSHSFRGRLPMDQ